MSFGLLLEEVRAGVALAVRRIGAPDVDYSVEPARPGFGDVTCNAPFLLAGPMGAAPREIAKRIADAYRGPGGGALVSGVEAHASGYVNFTADVTALARTVIGASVVDGWGRIDVGGSARVTVEHTSVNPNKALHIGHVRNVVIGDVVARVLRKANHDVTVLNYVDDSGLQVADIVLGFRDLGFDEEPPKGVKFDRYCGDVVYVGTTRKYEERPDLKAVRDGILAEIEGGTSETADFAVRVTRRVLEGQLQTCMDLHASYDCINYESHILRSGLWGRIFEKLKAEGLIEFENDGKNAGCWVVRGEADGGGNKGKGKGDGGDGRDGDDGDDDDRDNNDKVLVRSNGTATYVAKDIPYAAWKLGLVDDPFWYEEYPVMRAAGGGGRTLWHTSLEKTGRRMDFTADRVITVIDSRQALLQGIITVLMDRFRSSPGSYVHLGYESVTLSAETAGMLGGGAAAAEGDGKKKKAAGGDAQMSGRKGIYVNADDVVGMLTARALDETRRRNPGLSDEEAGEVARDVAIGTIRYEMIRQDLDKPIRFDLNKSLGMEGDTAPYVQYAHARAARILEKAGDKPDLDADYSLLGGAYEADLVKRIGMFPDTVGDAARNLSPKVVARYCHDLAVAFNSFYEHVRVIDMEDRAATNARMCLVLSFESTIRQALSLLGVNAPDRM